MTPPVGEPVSVFMAFLAGLLSFVSPCVLPIVPGYLSFISGINMAEFRGDKPAPGLARRVGITSGFFVLGFSTIFITLGATATLVGYYLQAYKRTLGMVGGVVIIFMGLHMTGILPIKWLLLEKRAEVRTRPVGLLGAYVVGLAFAFGWTPCIGPILGMILAMAAQQDTVFQGILLLAAYSAGLGIPFIVSGLAINGFFAAFARMRRHLKVVEYVAGGLLICVGLLLVTDRLTVLSNYFAKYLPFLPTG